MDILRAVTVLFSQKNKQWTGIYMYVDVHCVNEIPNVCLVFVFLPIHKPFMMFYCNANFCTCVCVC